MNNSWRLRAACIGVDDIVFFPIRESIGQYNAAKAYCAKCPVTAECLQLALDTRSLDGVFGGTTPAERRRILNGQVDADGYGMGHGDKAGTTAGYYREKAAGLRPCVECMAAFNDYARRKQAGYAAKRASEAAAKVSVSG